MSSFLGLANYYRRFIKNFAAVASPLNKLTHKNGWNEYYWNKSCDKAFHILKSCLTSAPILAYPDDKPVQEPNIDQSVPAATSVTSEDSETNNIEHTIKERKRKGKKQFLVKWESCGPEHKSWVDEGDIIHLDLQQQNND